MVENTSKWSKKIIYNFFWLGKADRIKLVLVAWKDYYVPLKEYCPCLWDLGL